MSQLRKNLISRILELRWEDKGDRVFLWWISQGSYKSGLWGLIAREETLGGLYEVGMGDVLRRRGWDRALIQ